MEGKVWKVSYCLLLSPLHFLGFDFEFCLSTSPLLGLAKTTITQFRAVSREERENKDILVKWRFHLFPFLS